MRDTLDGVIKLLKYTTLSFQSPISTNVAGRGMFTIVTPHRPVSLLEKRSCKVLSFKFYNHREGPSLTPTRGFSWA